MRPSSSPSDPASPGVPGDGVDRRGPAGPPSPGLFGGIFAGGAAGEVSEAAFLAAMLDVEAALAVALERAGLAAEGSAAAVRAAAVPERFSPAEIGAAAVAAGNPVPALVRALTAAVPPAYRGCVHLGATSQDVLDTAAMLVLRRALPGLLDDLARAAGAAAGLARRHRDTLMVGRTLLQPAVPVTFGLVAAGWLVAIDDARAALRRTVAERAAVQFGGAAGTLAPLGEAGPRVAALLGAELDLPVPALPWHADRLRVVEIAAALAGVAAVLGKIARDVTLLAQAEVGEVTERARPGHGGSSTMPHKRNPVTAVMVLGCARRVPGLLATLVAAAEQEHQRAAGAWHAEWEPWRQMVALVASAAAGAGDLVAGLRAHPERMRANLAAAGPAVLAERLVTLLAPALGRLPAHDLVAEIVAAGGGGPAGALAADPRVARAGVTADDIDAALDPAGYLGSAGAFVDRALAAHASRPDPGARESDERARTAMSERGER